MFKPTVLYIMQHTITKKLYFGKTNQLYRTNYLGSGIYWSRHIEKHGKEFVVRIWQSEIFVDESECKEFALAFSELYNIAESDSWANMIPEDGTDGHAAGFQHTDETKSKISSSLIGKRSPKSKYTIKEKLETRSARCRENNIGLIWANNGSIETKCKIEDLPAGFVLGRLNCNWSDNGMAKRITEYNLNPKTCLICEGILEYEKRKRTYCSRSCATRGRHAKHSAE